MELISVNPKNNNLIDSWDIHNSHDVINILENANKAYLNWKDTDLSFRINCLDDIANVLRENSSYAARVRTLSDATHINLTLIHECWVLCFFPTTLVGVGLLNLQP